MIGPTLSHTVSSRALRLLRRAAVPVACGALLLAATGCGSSLRAKANAIRAQQLQASHASAAPAPEQTVRPVTPEEPVEEMSEEMEALVQQMQAYTAQVEQALDAPAPSADPMAETLLIDEPAAVEISTEAVSDSGVAWGEPTFVPAEEMIVSAGTDQPAEFLAPGVVREAPQPIDLDQPEPVAETTAAVLPVATMALPPESLAEIDRALGERLGADPTDVSAHLEQQVLAWLRHDDAPDPAAIAQLPVEDRELVSAVVDGLSNLRSTLARGEDLRRQDKIEPLVQMADRLSRGGNLRLASVQVCSRVDGFGTYAPMDAAFSARLPPGQAAHALIYAEVENFTSQLNGEGKWETRLVEQCGLYSDSGLQVWATQPTDVVDVTRKKRNDFFVSKRLTLPEELPPGSYTLKFTITDDYAKRITEATLPLTITPPGDVAVR